MRFALVLVALALLRSPLQAQDERPPESLSADELHSETKRLTIEIHKLKNSPDAPKEWQELMKSEAELHAFGRKMAADEELLRSRIDILSRKPEIIEWRARIDKLSKRLDELGYVDRRMSRGVGVRLFQQRHAELLARGTPACPQLHALDFNVLTFPKIDGSTSTQPLAVLIASRYFDAQYEWVGRRQIRPTTQIEDFYKHREPEAELFEFTLQAKPAVASNGRLATLINGLLAAHASTHEAYVNLIKGRSELGLLARPPAPDELELARSSDIQLEVTPCALDAFVLLVNSDNSIRNLSTKQVQGIYSGQIKDWAEIGNFSGQITAYQREENSGSQQLMRDLLMKDIPLAQPQSPYLPPHLVGRGMSNVFLELTTNKLGIGYSVYYYERFMSGSPRTRVIAIDGAEPNEQTLASRQYPHVSEVVAVTRAGLGKDAPAAKLREWLLSPEGQSIVYQSGYVPISRKSN